MSDESRALVPGEHVDLDSGTMFVRSGKNPSQFTIKFAEANVTVERDEIVDMAELAGFEVIDRA